MIFINDMVKSFHFKFITHIDLFVMVIILFIHLANLCKYLFYCTYLISVIGLSLFLIHNDVHLTSKFN